MAVKTWTQTSGNLWSTGANWSGGTVPVSGDSVVFDGTSTANCTADSLGTFAGAVALNAGYTGVVTQSGNVTITTLTINAGTWTKTTQTLTMTTLTVAAGTFNGGSGAMSTTVSVVFNNASGNITATSGTWSTKSTWTVTNSPTVNLNNGTIDITNGGTFNAPGIGFGTGGSTFVITYTGGTTVVISNGTSVNLGANPTVPASVTVTGTLAGTGTLTISQSVGISATTGTLSGFTALKLVNDGDWNVSGATSTIPAGMDVEYASNAAGGCTFAGGGKTYGKLVRTGTAGGLLQIQDSNTFTYFQDDTQAAVAHTWQFQASRTQTLTDANPFRIKGSSGNVITITSTSSTNATLTATHGSAAISGCDYLAVDDVTVDAAPVWYAGANSTGDGTEVNWIYTDPPAIQPPRTMHSSRMRRVA